MECGMKKQRTSLSRKRVNHRTQVGIKRREATRARLIRGALHVFASHGVEAKVIELVIEQAGVSRGTFYNYFRTNEELFIAVAEEVSNEIIRIVDPLVQQQNDPAARLACGVSSVIRLAKAYPLFAQFIVRGGPPALCAGSLVTEVVPRDVAAGMASGRFSLADPRLAFDVILGSVISAFHTVLTEGVSEDYPKELAQAVLQALGVTKAMAQKFAGRDFGTITLAPDSLFAQA
jgi:AcrR family transcriptional regulator